MSDERFIPNDYEYIQDTKTGEFKHWYLWLDFLNQLSEENEMLKEQLNEMIVLFDESGLDYFISDELEKILNE